jgi:HSP20 family molecular chaperone IbpA
MAALSSLYDPRARPEVVAIVAEDQEFVFRLDLSLFSCKEFSVKVMDREVVVECAHEERRDGAHGWVARQFSRRFALPDDAEGEGVSATLDNDGVLAVRVPRGRRVETPEEPKVVFIAVSEEKSVLK